MQLRDATAGDVEGLLAIYNDAVAHTTAIWNERLVDAADRAAWLAERQGRGHPVLVAVDEEGSVLGYATFGPWRPHDGYRHTAESSVYIRRDRQGSGLGRALMTALIARARSTGLHVLIAGIDAANAPSIHLHERLGFERVAHLKEVGTKFGRWLDLVFLQLTLNASPDP